MPKLSEMDISEIVNTTRYPIADRDTEEYSKFVASLRASFVQTGIVTLPGFLRTDAIAGNGSNKNYECGWSFDKPNYVYLV